MSNIKFRINQMMVMMKISLHCVILNNLVQVVGTYDDRDDL